MNSSECAAHFLCFVLGMDLREKWTWKILNEINMSEITTIIIKNSKIAGVDSVTGEILKYRIGLLIKCLCDLFNVCEDCIW